MHKGPCTICDELGKTQRCVPRNAWPVPHHSLMWAAREDFEKKAIAAWRDMLVQWEVEWEAAVEQETAREVCASVGVHARARARVCVTEVLAVPQASLTLKQGREQGLALTEQKDT